MREKIALTILRIGLGVVFLIFGIGKFRNDLWAQTIRNMDFFLSLPWSVNISIFFIGVLEVLTGISLIIGFFTRFFALLAVLELAGILVLLNFQEVRDIGLMGIAVFFAVKKNDSLGVDYIFKKHL